MLTAERVGWAKLRVTFLILAALSIMIMLIYLLTGGTLARKQVTLLVFLPDATGIAKGSPVRVDGVQVGKVRSVELSGSAEPNRVVKVEVLIDSDRLASITEDSTAQTSADTVVGDMFI